jgi:hypothetical protein
VPPPVKQHWCAGRRVEDPSRHIEVSPQSTISSLHCEASRRQLLRRLRFTFAKCLLLQHQHWVALCIFFQNQSHSLASEPTIRNRRLSGSAA